MVSGSIFFHTLSIWISDQIFFLRFKSKPTSKISFGFNLNLLFFVFFFLDPKTATKIALRYVRSLNFWSDRTTRKKNSIKFLMNFRPLLLGFSIRRSLWSILMSIEISIAIHHHHHHHHCFNHLNEIDPHRWSDPSLPLPRFQIGH